VGAKYINVALHTSIICIWGNRLNARLDKTGKATNMQQTKLRKLDAVPDVGFGGTLNSP
jgi:hypothetical protein